MTPHSIDDQWWSSKAFHHAQLCHLSPVAVTGIVGVGPDCGVAPGSGVIGPVAASRNPARRRALSTASSRFFESSARMWADLSMRRLYSSAIRVGPYFWASFIVAINSAMCGLNTLWAISTYNDKPPVRLTLSPSDWINIPFPEIPGMTFYPRMRVTFVRSDSPTQKLWKNWYKTWLG